MKTANEMFKELGYKQLERRGATIITFKKILHRGQFGENSYIISFYSDGEVEKEMYTEWTSGYTNYAFSKEEILACAQLVKELENKE